MRCMAGRSEAFNKSQEGDDVRISQSKFNYTGNLNAVAMNGH